MFIHPRQLTLQKDNSNLSFSFPYQEQVTATTGATLPLAAILTNLQQILGLQLQSVATYKNRDRKQQKHAVWLHTLNINVTKNGNQKA